MKILFQTSIAVILCLSALVLTSYSRIETGTVSYGTLVATIDSLPADVREVINASCVKCHASGGRSLAMAKLDFSKWAEYDAVKKAKKADVMCRELTKGSMPPKSFLKNHPELSPTAEQIEAICNWAVGLNSDMAKQ